jgi:hypothetical protein
MPAPSIYRNNQHGTTITSTNTTNSHHHNHRVQSDLTIPINIASPKVEKEYDAVKPGLAAYIGLSTNLPTFTSLLFDN